MSKNEQRTITLPPEAWAYIDALRGPMRRTPSQEIEYSMSALKVYRERGDAEALKLAESHNPRRKTTRRPESDESS